MNRPLSLIVLGIAACFLSPPGAAVAQWQTTGNDIYYMDGKVGIGTSSPTLGALEVIPHPGLGASFGMYVTTPPGGFGAIYAHTLSEIAIRGDSDGGGGIFATTMSGTAFRASAFDSTGVPIAIHASNLSPDGYAIYSESGKNAFFDPVGIGTNIPIPQAKLQVLGAVGDLALDVNGQLFVNDAQSFVGVGRSTRINPFNSTEVFGIEGPGLWAGMYVKTGINQNPYYGYANAGNPQAYHYYHGQSDQWRLWLGADRLAVAMNGFVGIGTTSPSYLLHVNGSAGKPGGGSWSNASDRRLKKDLFPLEGSLEKMLALRGVSYEYIDPDAIGELRGRQVGMVAQEVEAVFPDWVDEGPGGYKRVTFRGFEALTVEAMRQLCAQKDAQVQALQQKNAALEARLARQEEATSDLGRRLKSLESAMGTSSTR